MNQKIFAKVVIAIGTYGLLVLLAINFYDDSPAKMKWEDREAYNFQFIAKLTLNEFTFEEALAQLGSPDITEAIKYNGKQYQVLFYRTQHVKSDGITTQEECTYLLFVDETLKAIGLGSNYPKNWQIIELHN